MVLLYGFSRAANVLQILASYRDLFRTLYAIGLTLLLAWLAARLLSFGVRRWLKIHKRYEKTPHLVGKAVSVFVFILAGIGILSYLRIEITPIVATLGIGGLAIGLALQNTLTNFFAGLHLISDRPIDVGDFIELEGVIKDTDVSGYVEDIGWRSTRIRTRMDNVIVIPNGKLSESLIVNDSLPSKDMKLYVTCGVAYESDLEEVERVVKEVGRRIQETVRGAVREYVPEMYYRKFGESNIDFRVTLRIERWEDRYAVTHAFIKELKKTFDERGIEISWPIQKIYHRTPLEITKE